MSLSEYTITLSPSHIAKPMEPSINGKPVWEIEHYEKVTNGTYGEGLFLLCNYTGDLEPLLDQHLTVTDANGNPCYCGYVEGVYRCCGDYIAWGWDASNLFNAIAVTWVEHSTRQRTDWYEDAASIARHGRRELVVSLPDQALYTPDDYAARLLLELRRPQPQLHNTYKCRCNTTYLRTQGYLNTLTWQSYTNESGYATSGAGFGRFDTMSNDTAYCQAITNPVAAPWTITHLHIGLRKVGNPQSPIGYSLHTDCNGPALIAGTLSLLAVGATVRYVETELSTPGLPIDPNGTLYLQLHVTGTDANNHYQLATAQLTDGVAATYSTDPTNWTSLNRTIALRCTEKAGLSAQLLSLLQQATFIGTVTERTAIGHLIPTYRPGYISLYTAVDQLLQLGDPEGLRLQLQMDCNHNSIVTTIHPLDPDYNHIPPLALNCCGALATDPCQLSPGRWLTPTAPTDVPGIFLDSFQVNHKQCRTRFRQHTFRRHQLADILRYPGIF